MDSLALQLAIKYATKSGKITLAQKVTDELVEQRKDQEEKQLDRQRSSSSSPPPSIPIPSHSTTSSVITISSTFEETKSSHRKVTTTSAGSFSNPFKKKLQTNPVKESDPTDELSQWKPSISKTRLSSTTKTLVQV